MNKKILLNAIIPAVGIITPLCFVSTNTNTRRQLTLESDLDLQNKLKKVNFSTQSPEEFDTTLYQWLFTKELVMKT